MKSTRIIFAATKSSLARSTLSSRTSVTIPLLIAVLMFLAPAAGAQTRHVFAVSALINGNPPSGFLYHYTSSNDTTWSETIDFTINGHANSTVPVYSSNIASFAGSGQICVAYVSFDSATQQKRQHVMRSTDNVNWTDTDLTTVNAPLPDTTAGVTGFIDSNGHPRVFYITQPISGNEFIAEALWNGSSWIWEGNLGGSAFAAPGTAVSGYLFNTTPQAFYIGTDGHIHEVYEPSGSGWLTTDVNAVSGGPLPISGSNLLGYKFNRNAPIHYFTADGHVHQIWWNGSSWKTNDVTQLAGAPSCVPGRENGVPAPLAGTMFNGQPTVACFTPDIIEMRWTGSQELWGDWTAANGGAPQFAPIAKYAINNHNTVFYVDGVGLPLHEYLWDGSANHYIQVQQIQYTPVEVTTAIF